MHISTFAALSVCARLLFASYLCAQTSLVPRTLSEAYMAALKVANTENIKLQKEILIEAKEDVTQAIGAFLPTLTGTVDVSEQALPADRTFDPLFPANQNTVKITADQPLFRGLRDVALLRQRKALRRAQKQVVFDTARQLFYDVATVYYNVLAYDEDVKNYNIEIGVNRKRERELKDFQKIGRSQLTDVLTFHANTLSLEALLEDSRRQLKTAKHTLSYITGWDPNTPLIDLEADVVEPGPLVDYLARAELRADVQAAMEKARATDAGVQLAIGAHLPDIDLIGDYYLVRTGALRTVNWDIQVAVSIPLFEGGIVQSKVRQAKAIARQYHYALAQAKRNAELEVKTLYEALVADQKQLVKLKELVRVSKLNSEAEVKDYRNGLVTNLDVLQAITTYQDAIRRYVHQRFAVRLDRMKLLAATGQRPEIPTQITKL
jgi:outer membrane protein